MSKKRAVATEPLPVHCAEDRQLVQAASGRAGAVIAHAGTGIDPARAVVELLQLLHPDHETTAVYPDGVSWKVAELDDHVLGPARFGTLTHRNIVIADSHRAAASAHDRLLKTFEEPFSDTTFWLTHPTNAELPATLRGRAQHTLHLAGPSTEAALEALRDAGAAHPENLLRELSNDLPLALAVTRYGMEQAAADFAQEPFTRTPHLLATRVLLAGAHLAIAAGHKTSRTPAVPSGKGTLPSADLTKLNPVQRSQLRRLLSTVIDRWTYDVLSRAAHVTTAAQMRRLENALEGLDAARLGMGFNTPLATVLTAAAVSINP